MERPELTSAGACMTCVAKIFFTSSPGVAAGIEVDLYGPHRSEEETDNTRSARHSISFRPCRHPILQTAIHLFPHDHCLRSRRIQIRFHGFPAPLTLFLHHIAQRSMQRKFPFSKRTLLSLDIMLKLTIHPNTQLFLRIQGTA